MYKAVQVPCRLFNRLAHVIVTIEIEHIRHEIQRVLVVGNIGVDTGQVEAVRKVVLVDFAEILVAPRRDELYSSYPNRTSAFGILLKWKKNVRKARYPCEQASGAKAMNE